MVKDEPESVQAGIDLRCPEPVVFRSGEERPGHLFAVLRGDHLRGEGQTPTYVHPGNLIELACWACRKRRRDAGESVLRVLHRFDFAGQLVETLVVPAEEEIMGDA